MQISIKRLTAGFAIAAGIGGGIGYYLAQPGTSATAMAPDAQTTTVHTSKPALGQISGLVTANQGDSLVTVLLHSWPGQMAQAEIAPQSFGRFSNGAEFRADFVDAAGDKVKHPAIGQTVFVENLQAKQNMDGLTSAIAGSFKSAPKDLQGPVTAQVIRMLDGDTFDVLVTTYDGSQIKTSIRVSGIDTPEKKGRAKCAGEAELAAQASAETAKQLKASNGVITLRDIKTDKYGGRMVAKVYLADGHSLGDVLIGKGLARAYEGKTKSSWCNIR